MPTQTHPENLAAEVTANATARTHKFEAAGLGRAPYRFVGQYESKFQACPGAPVQPGTSCDYCSTGIMQVYKVRSADGREFKVGCDCIRKVDDAGLVKIVADHERKARRAKADAKAKAVSAELAVVLEAVTPKLQAMPHPFPAYAAQGRTMLDSVKNRLGGSGAAGRARLLKELKTLNAKSEVA